MSEALVLPSSPSPGVRVLTFNRPAKRNALSQALIDDFVRELAVAQKEDAVKIIVVTGGKEFFSGQFDSLCILNSRSENGRWALLAPELPSIWRGNELDLQSCLPFQQPQMTATTPESERTSN